MAGLVVLTASRSNLLKSRPVTKVELISSLTISEYVISPMYFPETIC